MAESNSVGLMDKDKLLEIFDYLNETPHKRRHGYSLNLYTSKVTGGKTNDFH